jgi:hypothetical protein
MQPPKALIFGDLKTLYTVSKSRLDELISTFPTPESNNLPATLHAVLDTIETVLNYRWRLNNLLYIIINIPREVTHNGKAQSKSYGKT